jgi:hypothetical protein
MHSFHDLDIKTLKKICSKYNLHTKISKYSKLSKDELIPHMEKHLHINSEGKIKMKKEVSETAETEINKMLHELKNKVKEVKEKVIKHHAKKEIHIEEKKEEKNDEEYKKKYNYTEKERRGFFDTLIKLLLKRPNETKLEREAINDYLKKLNINEAKYTKLNHILLFGPDYKEKPKINIPDFDFLDNKDYYEKKLNELEENYNKNIKKGKEKKTIEQIKEEEIIEALPLYHKLNDYEGVERNTKLNDMCLKMEHFPSVLDCLIGIEEYLKKHPEADKPKQKEKKKEVKPATEAQKKEMEDIMKMMKPKKEIQIDDNNYMQEEKKRKDEIKKDEMKKYITNQIKEEEKQNKRDMEELKVLEDKKTKTKIQKIAIQKLKDFIEIGNNRIEELKKKLPKEEHEEKTPVDKIEKMENIINKLENIMNINEKEIRKPKHDNDSDAEEYIPMKPKTASNVNSLKVSELKELAKKHNISLKHKVNNKEVAKGAPMLRKEIINYLKL